MIVRILSFKGNILEQIYDEWIGSDVSYIKEFQDIKAVKFAFNGIRAGVLALLIKALITVGLVLGMINFISGK